MKIKKLITNAAIACTLIGVTACNSGTSSGGNNGGGQNDISKPEIMGYYTNWSTYAANYQPNNIPEQVDAVLYAFAQVGPCGPDSGATMKEPFKCKRDETFIGIQTFALYSTDPNSDFYSYKDTAYISQPGKGNIAKTLATGKKVRLSVGGWSLSAALGEAIKPNHREKFAQSIIDFMQKAEADAATKKVNRKFDGIDIDWEPNGNLWTLPATDPNNVSLTKADLENYYQFLKILKTKLTDNGYPTLSIAMTANPNAISNVEQVYGRAIINGIYGDRYWEGISKLGIKLNMMTYDYNAQGWDNECPDTQFNSPLFSDKHNPCGSTYDLTIENSINTLMSGGVKPKYIGIGVPAYGHAYSLNNINDVVPGQSFATFNPFVLYNVDGLKSVYNVAIPSFEHTWTNRNILTGRAYGGASESENTTWNIISDTSPSTQTVATALVDNKSPAFITYTGFNDAKKVMEYAQSRYLSGVMVWALDQDIQPGDTSSSGSSLEWDKASVVAGLIAGSGKTPTPAPSTPYFILQVTNTAPDAANPNAYASATLVINNQYFIFGTSWGSPIAPGYKFQLWGTTPSAQNPGTPGVENSTDLNRLFANGGGTAFTTSQVLINGYPSQDKLNEPANQYNCVKGQGYTFQAGHTYNLMVNAVGKSCDIQMVN